MRILFIGDVVGRSGSTVISERLPKLVRDWKLDLVIINGENAAGGFGITEAIYRDFIEAGADAIILDFHGEATSEKQAMGYFCDGRASLVVGTHTHTPTADLRILAGGTAYMSDVGMTGDYDSVIGMDKEEPLRRFTSKIPSGRFEPALGPATLCAIAAEIGRDGLTKAIAPVRIGGLLEPAEPGFWA